MTNISPLPGDERCIAILSSREHVADLTRTVEAAERACARSPALIDIVVNGNETLAKDMATWLARRGPSTTGSALRVWFVPLGDKSHAWNTYLHDIWPETSTAFFIDGYARVNNDALDLIEAALRDKPDALGATGVPTVGASANKLRRQMLQGGGIHGNLFALRSETMHALKRMPFRLPLGLYRMDSLIGAVLCLSLKPENEWLQARIHVVGEASWEIDEKQWLSFRTIRAEFRRFLRQQQGVLENLANQHHLRVRRASPAALAGTIAEVIETWRGDAPAEARRIALRHPLTLLTLRKLKQPRDWSLRNHEAQLLSSSSHG